MKHYSIHEVVVVWMMLMSGTMLWCDANCAHFARCLWGRFGRLDELSQINHKSQNTIWSGICQFQSWAEHARQSIWWEELEKTCEAADSHLCADRAYLSCVFLLMCHLYLSFLYFFEAHTDRWTHIDGTVISIPTIIHKFTRACVHMYTPTK